METTRSASYFERAKKLFPGGVNSPVRAFNGVGGTPFAVKKGEGAYLVDLDGNHYVDFINSWGPLVLGHAHPVVVEAINRQVLLGTSYGAGHELEAELAEKVQTLFPLTHMMRFTSSGTEAGMAVIRLARGFTGRSKILKFQGCYHGHVDSLLTKAGSGVMTLGLPGSSGIPAEVVASTIVAQFNDMASVEDAFAQYGSDIAAVILEPVVGNCGLIIPEKGFLTALAALTKSAGALLIFDEVMTGFRVDLRGAQGLYGITPDLTMFGKVIGGGLPVGAYGGRADIMSCIAPVGPVYQAGTLSGNPLAMAAGLATLGEWTKENVFESAARETRRLMDGMASLARDRDIPIVTDCVGTMFGFFFSDRPVRTFADTERLDVRPFKRFFHLALEEGLYFAPSAFEAGFMSSAHTPKVIDLALEKLEIVFRKLSG